MCLQVSAVLPWHDWNWSGDEIIHTPVVPACRPIPRTGKRYPIDIREFLMTANNAVVGSTLGGLVKALPPRLDGNIHLKPADSASYQKAAYEYAAAQKICRVDIDLWAWRPTGEMGNNE